MRILALLTDAYGGFGGIAVYNRDVVRAMCEHPGVSTVSALPRKVTHDLQALPDGLDYRIAASKGGLAFLQTAAGEALRGTRPAFIYCAHVNLAPVALALRMRWRAPVLCALYGIEAWQPTGRGLADQAVRRLDRFYSISRITRSRFINWSKVSEDQIDLLPNAIHLENYGIAPARAEIVKRYGLAGRKVLLTLGRIVSKERAKGFDEVIDVLPELRKREPSIFYVVAGDGDYRPALEAKVAERGLGDHVVFTGFVSDEDKADLYRVADAYVMPSRGEGFGFVFLEAMACGTPCVASSVDGSADAVRDGELGAMVDPEDRDGLIAAILAALEKPRVIPAGLDDFAYPAFRQRVHGIVDALTGRMASMPAVAE